MPTLAPMNSPQLHIHTNGIITTVADGNDEMLFQNSEPHLKMYKVKQLKIKKFIHYTN